MRKLAAFLLTPVLLCSTELAPWFGTALQIEPRISGLYQGFSDVDQKSHLETYHSDAFFLNLSVGTSIIDIANVEFEYIAAQTPHHTFNTDCGRMTLRYHWMNDIVGDALSVVPGVRFTMPTKLGLHDVSSFHNGYFESEFLVAFGKEYDECVRQRWWSLVGIGTATTRSPWWRGDLHWEANYRDVYFFEVFCKSLWGCGGDSLRVHHFDGYGRIQHRSIDVGAAVSRLFDCLGTVKLEYTHRVYAYNFPVGANVVQITIFNPLPF